MTGSRMFSQEASSLGSAFRMHLRCASSQWSPHLTNNVSEALPYHQQRLLRGIQPMVPPSWKYFFRIWYAQHVGWLSPLPLPGNSQFELPELLCSRPSLDVVAST